MKKKGIFSFIIALFLAIALAAGVWSASGGTLEGLWKWAGEKGQQAKECILNKGDCLKIEVPKHNEKSTPHHETPSDSQPENVQDKLYNVSVNDTKAGGYERSEWKHWVPYGRSCWSSREESLYRHGKDIVLLDANKKETTDYNKACSIKSGKWTDPYDGTIETDPKRMDIDHIVALKATFEKGGNNWDYEKRKEYANDVDDVLIPTTAKMNRSKGAFTPDEWQAPTQEGRCFIAKNTVKIYNKYGLTATTNEKAYLATELAKCK